ncbi:MAG TPA: cyclic nucleotide-binding domain-containing protein, partial [bacterium]
MTTAPGPLRMVIVDPKPQSRSILKGALTSLEMVHTVIERGATADLQELLEKEPIQLVMLERYLADGLDALGAIRTLSERLTVSSTRYVIIDQREDLEYRTRAAELGVTGFLYKPFDQPSLKQALWDGLGFNEPPGGEAKPAGPRIPQDVLDRLKRVQVFAAFTDAELVNLLRICHVRQIPAGKYIFRQGDAGDQLYVLISGRVEIRRGQGAESRVLDTWNPGQCFGEMAIIDSAPRSADAVAALDSIVIGIRAETVNRDDDLIALKLVRQ